MLSVSGLSASYGSREVLQGVDLYVGEGELVALVGPNGAGKSTLMKAIVGFIEPTAGLVTIGGHAPGTIEARRSASFVADNPVLYDDLSVIEHLEYIARMHDYEDWAERAEFLIETLGLSARRDDLPSKFSRGLRQKTALAVGLVRPLDLLLVDEPFVGLDALGKRALVQLLDTAAADGAGVLVSTHELTFVERATRCVALVDGRVIDDRPMTVDEVMRVIG